MHEAVTFDRSDLEALCRKYGVRHLELFGRPVDLMMPRAVRNPYLKADIDRDRTLLYATCKQISRSRWPQGLR